MSGNTFQSTAFKSTAFSETSFGNKSDIVLKQSDFLLQASRVPLADGASVPSWRDTFGREEATQAVVANQGRRRKNTQQMVNAIHGKKILTYAAGNYIGLPKITEMNAEMSQAIWFKTVNTTTNQYLIHRHSYSGDFYARFGNSNMRFQVKNEAGTQLYAECTTAKTLIGDGRWHHLCGTVKSDGKIRVYLDGVPESESDFMGTIMQDSVYGGTWIGGRGTADTFIGSTQEARFWNKELTADEVMSDYLGGRPQAGSIRAEYLLTGGTGSSVADTSGNAFTGTITGASWSTEYVMLDSIMFDGTDDYYSTNIVADTEDCTFIFAGKTTTNSVPDMMIFAASGATTRSYFGFSNGYFGVGAGTLVMTTAKSTTRVGYDMTPFVGTAIRSGNTLKIRINGAEEYSGSYTGTAINGLNYRLGAHNFSNGAASLFYKGVMGRLLLAKSALPLATIQNIERKFGAELGISIA